MKNGTNVMVAILLFAFVMAYLLIGCRDFGVEGMENEPDTTYSHGCVLNENKRCES